MVSCESKISFTFLPEHSATGIYNRDNENKGKKYVYYSVLVNNLPKEKKDLEKLLSFYHLKFRDSIFNNPDMDTFLTWFYQKITQHLILSTKQMIPVVFLVKYYPIIMKNLVLQQ